MHRGLLATIAARAEGADLIVAEGSMGLYDGVATQGESGWARAPRPAALPGLAVLLVLDVGGQAQSAAATALGFARYRDDLPFAGVILNRVASPRHERLARLGMERVGLPVLGALPRQGDLTLPERHLGLIQAVEHPDLDEAIAAYAAFLRAHSDLAAIRTAAAKADVSRSPSALPPPPAQRIALAQDEAFSFVYPHLLESWRVAGAEILPFSPLTEKPRTRPRTSSGCRAAIPSCMRAGWRRRAAFTRACAPMPRPAPVHGECGGYMALGQALVDKHGQSHPWPACSVL